MPTYFTGTSTGNRYEVGRTYEMNGAAYTAQPDGSFVKEGNIVGQTDSGRVVTDSAGRGQSLQGSAGNPDVNWYHSGGSIASSSSAAGYNPGSSVASAGGTGSQNQQIARDNQVRTTATSQGGGVVPIANGNRGPSQMVVRVAAAGAGVLTQQQGRFAPWRGIDDPEQHTMLFGQQFVAAPSSSNMAMFEERYGDAELGTPGWFATWGIAADDWRHNLNVRVYGTENTYDREYRSQVQRAFIEDAGEAVIDWGFSTIESVRQSAADGQAIKDAAAAGRAAEYDAWNAREELQRQEAEAMELRREQRNNPPAVTARFLGLN